MKTGGRQGRFQCTCSKYNVMWTVDTEAKVHNEWDDRNQFVNAAKHCSLGTAKQTWKVRGRKPDGRTVAQNELLNRTKTKFYCIPPQRRSVNTGLLSSSSYLKVKPDSRHVLLKHNIFSFFLHNANWMMNLCSNHLSIILFSNSRAISDYRSATCWSHTHSRVY
jgi:hypothetical protein